MKFGKLCFITLILVTLVYSFQDVTAQKKVDYDESLYSALEYRSIGPFRGGRSAAVAGVPGDPMTFYFGGTGGGMWKTTDGAKTSPSLRS